MKAAVLFAANTPLEIRDIEIDKPGPREVLVQVAASGLCHSDWHFMSGGLAQAVPAVLGHEAAGIVEAVGVDVRDIGPGDHVVTCALTFCGHCEQCVTGHTNVCTDKPERTGTTAPRLTLAGTRVHQGARLAAFAEQILVDRNGVVKVDRAMPLDRAALMGCSVLTGLGAVFQSAQVRPGSRVAVIGSGGVGLSVIQGARIAGASQIVAVDLNPEKRGIAEHFGATHFVAAHDNVVAEVRELTGGGADYAFEVIGLPATVVQALAMLRVRGVLTLVGVTNAGVDIPMPGLQIVLNEWSIQGTFFGSAAFTQEIPRFARMYLDGKLDLDPLLSETIRLDEVNRGFADMIGGHTQARKVITFADVMAVAARG